MSGIRLSLLLLLFCTAAPLLAQEPPLRVAQDAAWPPFAYLDDDGEPQGMLVDFWRAYGRVNGREVEFVLVDWQQSLEAVRDGKADVHGGLFESAPRDAYLDFSDALLPLSTRLFLASGMEANGFSDLDEIPVGVTRGGFEEEFMRSNHPGIALITFDNNGQMVKAASAGKIEAFVADYPVGMYFLNHIGAPEQFRVVDTLYTKQLHAAVADGDAELLAAINDGLKRIPEAERDRIINKWLLSVEVTPRWLWPTVIAAGLVWLLIGLVVYTRILKRHVRSRTAELEREIVERKAVEADLRRERERAQGYLDTVQTIMVALDGEGTIRMINNAGLDLLGYREEELLGRNWFETCLPQPEGSEQVLPVFRELMAGNISAVEYSENPVLCRDGSVRLVAWHNSYLSDEEGRVTGTLGSGQDITERKKLENEMRQHAAVFQHAREAIMVLDAGQRATQVNDTFSEITGYSREEMLGQNPRLLQSGRHDEQFYRQMYKTLEREGKWQGELWNRRKDGEVFPVWQTITVVRGNDGAVNQYISIFSDISEKKLAEERVRHLAHYDALTDLPNRFLFEERCSRALARAQRNDYRVAVMFLDLDRFKLINDSYGHAVGDEMLQLVASRLQQNMREEDTVARIGGDEFIIVVENFQHKDDLASVAGKVIDNLNLPFELQGEHLHIGASIGISLFPRDGSDVETLVKRADIAMYRAKGLGRNGFGFFGE